jgi:hypothetical protein
MLGYTRTEYDFAKYIKNKIREKSQHIKVMERSSLDSSSRYLFCISRQKAACIRISDHIKQVPSGRIRHETRRTINDSFYLFVTNGFRGKNYYEPHEIDNLINDVLEYLSVSSNE